MKRIILCFLAAFIGVMGLNSCAAPSNTDNGTETPQTQPYVDTEPPSETAVQETETQAKNEPPTEATQPAPVENSESGLAFSNVGVLGGKMTYCIKSVAGETYENPYFAPLPDFLNGKAATFLEYNGYIYYTPLANGSGGFAVEIRRVKPDGSGEEVLASDLSYGGNCVLYRDVIYYQCFSDADNYYDVASVDVNTLEKKRWEQIKIAPEVYYNGAGFFVSNANYIYAFDTSTGVAYDMGGIEAYNIICLDGEYLYYVPYGHETLMRVNVSNIGNAPEALPLPAKQYISVIDNVVYSTKNETGAMIRNDIATGQAEILGSLNVGKGIYGLRRAGENLLYTVSNGNEGTYVASDYLYDVSTNTSTLISSYYVAQF